jgi:hypothetical protein
MVHASISKLPSSPQRQAQYQRAEYAKNTASDIRHAPPVAAARKNEGRTCHANAALK